MNKPDMVQVVERLNAMAELYAVKPPTAKAIELWWEAIRGYTAGDVLGALDGWMRSRPKMPMPSDIVSMASSRLSDRIEAQAVADKAQEKREIQRMAATPHGRAVLNAIKEILGKKPERQRPAPPPRAREPGDDDEEIFA